MVCPITLFSKYMEIYSNNLIITEPLLPSVVSTNNSDTAFSLTFYTTKCPHKEKSNGEGYRTCVFAMTVFAKLGRLIRTYAEIYRFTLASAPLTALPPLPLQWLLT